MIKNHRILRPQLLIFLAITMSGCQALKSPVAPSLSSAPAVSAVDLQDLDLEKAGLPEFEPELEYEDAYERQIIAFADRFEALPSDSPLINAEIRIEAEHALAHQAMDSVELGAWGRLQNNMKMDAVMNRRVRTQLEWYLRNPEYLRRTMQRAKPFLPHILNVLEEKDLPGEYALLPIVESAFQTFAYSHGRASGMWQIIPSTGRFLGLKQDWWYDGRRDIIESTDAATRYLKSLASQFDNDWELALAAYNAGPGKIRSAIRHNQKQGKPTDFWHLTAIRRETRDYVPKLLALKAIFEDPQSYDLELIPVDDEPGYVVVELDSQIDLALAAEMAEISTDDLYHMNPAFNRWATAPDGPHRLLLPPENAETFKTALDKLPRQDRIKWVRHKIRQGETLSHIARKYRTTVELVKDLNKIRGSNIRAGKHLLIPTATRSLASYSQSESQRLEKIQNTPRKGERSTHIVKSGESFWSISRRYGVGTRTLAKWNGMAPTDTLRVGQKLVVWQAPDSTTQATAMTVSLNPSDSRRRLHTLKYTVRKGDSLYLIANRFNVSVADIKKWNQVGKYLQPGQKLKLKVDVTRQSG